MTKLCRLKTHCHQFGLAIWRGDQCMLNFLFSNRLSSGRRIKPRSRSYHHLPYLSFRPESPIQKLLRRILCTNNFNLITSISCRTHRPIRASYYNYCTMERVETLKSCSNKICVTFPIDGEPFITILSDC